MHRIINRYRKPVLDAQPGLLLRVALRLSVLAAAGENKRTAGKLMEKARLPWRVLIALFAGMASMHLVPPALADEGPEERWNAFGQATYIWQHKDAFPAAYTNLNGTPNSLLPEKEHSFTTTVTGYFGWRAWRGGEVYAAPEIISELPLSGLRGLAGSIQNGELEKNGMITPTLYLSRLFLRQTWGLGGESSRVESGPMQLAGSVDSRRFVLTAGNLSVIDMFDRIAYAGDVRQQFLNMNFLTYAAYDFAADARGYSWGIAGEYYRDDWVFRAGRFLGPLNPNQLHLDRQIMNHYGDQFELEHQHELAGKPGKLRLLAYRNVEHMGSFDDAVSILAADPTKNATTCTGFNYNSANTGAPDLCWARKRNTKIGLGVAAEQQISDNAGVFFRGMKSDGKTEVFSYTATDSSVSVGTIVGGGAWGRARDSVGLGYAQNWISAAHVRYLNLGGIDGFIGDGRISYKPERLVEAYYNINLTKRFWLTLDWQRVENPAYNSDRGPVTMVGARLHAEF